MKLKSLCVAAVLTTGLVFAGKMASAATFNFADIANTEGERGFATFVRTIDGIGLTATGSNLDGTASYFAYLDGKFNGLNGGLGVCKTLTAGNQCDPSSDDNLTEAELLTLQFDRHVILTQTLFRNALHQTTFASDDDFEVSIDSGTWMSYPLTHTFNTPLTGSEFRFVVDRSGDGDQLYIESITTTAATPEPGSWMLMGTGVVGLLGYGWHRKNREAV